MFKSSFVAAAIATVAGALVFACGSSSSSSSNGGDTTDDVDGSTRANDNDGSTTNSSGDDGSSTGTGTGDDTSGDGGTGGTGTGDGSVSIHSEIAEQTNNMCPTSPTIATGTGAQGSACKTAYDCAPVCCACGTIDAGSGNWLAASCQGSGQCSQATACADSVPGGGFHCTGTIGDASTD